MNQPTAQSTTQKPMTISKFAQVSIVPVTTLRFWDEVGIFKPALVDPESKYRYYTIEQMPLACEIYYFARYARMPLDEISRMLEATPEQRKNLLEQHLERLKYQVTEIQNNIIMTQQLLLHPDKRPLQVEIKEIAPQTIAFIRLRTGLDIDRISLDRKQAFDEIFHLLDEQNISPSGSPFSEFPRTEKFNENDFEALLCVAIEKPIISNGRIEVATDAGGSYACALHHGHYYFLGETHMAICKWMQEQGKDWSSSREYYLYGPRDTEELELHRTEVCYTIR